MNDSHYDQVDRSPELFERDVAELKKEVNDLTNRVQELLSANTRLVEERRAIDRYAMLQTAHRNVFDQPVRHVPIVPADDEVRFRARLAGEEFFEHIESMFIESKVEPWHLQRLKEEIAWVVDNCPVQVDLIEVADSSTDLKVILEGTDVTFGIPAHEVFAEVHRANMEKAGGPVREDGKKGKPPGWREPDIGGVLRRAGWNG